MSWNYDRYGTLTPAAVAGVVPAANWTNSWPSNPLTDLVDSTGSPTTLDITYSSWAGWSIQGSDPGLDADGTSNKRLLNGYLNAGPAAWNPPVTASSVTISDIPHQFYDIIVYFSADVAGREGLVSDGVENFYFSTAGPAAISGGNAAFIRTTQASDSAYPTANYALFSGLSGDSHTIFVQMRDNDEWGGIAGFQLVPRADPLRGTTIAIQAAGANATLSWPAGLGGVILETSDDLQVWTAVDPQPATNSAVVPLTGTKRFYRLSRP